MKQSIIGLSIFLLFVATSASAQDRKVISEQRVDRSYAAIGHQRGYDPHDRHNKRHRRDMHHDERKEKS